MPSVLFLCIAIGTIIVGYFFGIWWILGLFAGYLAVGVISIVVRSRGQLTTSRESQPKDAPLKGWEFEIEEISPGHYRAAAWDQSGRTVSREGGDPESVLIQCRQDAAQIIRRE